VVERMRLVAGVSGVLMRMTQSVLVAFQAWVKALVTGVVVRYPLVDMTAVSAARWMDFSVRMVLVSAAVVVVVAAADHAAGLGTA
jgi:hypothetical protein